MEFEKETFDFKLLTESKIKKIIKAGQAELSKRERKRREELINAFVKAWRALEEDGAYFYVDGDQVDLEEVDIE